MVQKAESAKDLTRSFGKAPKLLSILVICLLLCGCERHAQSSEVPAAEATKPAAVPNKVTLTPEAVVLAKIKSAPVNVVADTAEIKTTGEIRAAETKVFHINSLVVGRVVEDRVNLGDVIKQGQVLAVVQNLEVTKIASDYVHQRHQNDVNLRQAQARLDLAQKNVDRLNQLNKEGIAPLKDVLAATNVRDLAKIEINGLKEHTQHMKAETTALLAAYGVKMDLDKEFAGVPTGSPLRSPKSGVIVQKSITLGDVVNTSEPLYVVADLSEVWLDINIYDKDIDKIRLGQSVTFRSDGLPGRSFKGTVNYIQPSAAGGTRTFIARAVFPNSSMALKPGMFGQVEILGALGSNGRYVPDSAIQRLNNDTFVFVDEGEGHYFKRNIDLGDRVMDGYLVKSGLAAGDHIVTSGALTLKAELFKGQIGE